MYSTTLSTIFVGSVLVYLVTSETPHCTGPTLFCENIVATSVTIDEAWAAYGASNAELTNSVLSSVISSLTAEQDNDFQECMINIHNQFNGASVSSTDPLCQNALLEETEIEAIDFYRDRFFYRVVLDFVKGVVTTMITVRDSGADCNLAECSYLITDSFPKVAMGSDSEEEEVKDEEEYEADEKELNTLLEKLKELNSEKEKRARSKQTQNTDTIEELAVGNTQEKEEERKEEERDLNLLLKMLKELDSNKIEMERIKEKRSKTESRAKKRKKGENQAKKKLRITVFYLHTVQINSI